jgi:two-component system, NarL family, response regulator LiaR
MTPPIRVMIIDDHDIVRRGLAMFLHGFEDMILVGEAATAPDALRVCEQVQPDVVLMDIMMPDTDGITLTRTFHARFPQVRVVILTSTLDEITVKSALEAGAIGYMLKNISVAEMANTIRSAGAGKPALAPEVTRTLINLSLNPRKTSSDYNLTEREAAVLNLMVKGLNNQAIADRLFVSRATVKAHVSTLLSKLGVQNRIEAVRMAVEQSLVS